MLHLDCRAGRVESNYHTHLQNLTSERCGTTTYYHTLVRTAYYPFCLGDVAQSAARRFESGVGTTRFGCTLNPTLKDSVGVFSIQTLYQFYLVDEYGLSSSMLKERDYPTTSSSSLAKKSGTKRKSAGDGG